MSKKRAHPSRLFRGLGPYGIYALCRSTSTPRSRSVHAHNLQNRVGFVFYCTRCRNPYPMFASFHFSSVIFFSHIRNTYNRRVYYCQIYDSEVFITKKTSNYFLRREFLSFYFKKKNNFVKPGNSISNLLLGGDERLPYATLLPGIRVPARESSRPQLVIVAASRDCFAREASKVPSIARKDRITFTLA